LCRQGVYQFVSLYPAKELLMTVLGQLTSRPAQFRSNGRKARLLVERLEELTVLDAIPTPSIYQYPYITVIVVVLLATAPLRADQPKENPADVKALHDLHQQYLAAYNRRDAKAVAAFYTPYADFLGFDGRMYKGRAEIENYLASTFDKVARLKSPFGLLRFLTPDVAIADRPSGLTPAPEGWPSKVHATVVYVKRGGKWMITSIRLMVPFQPSKR
jgi:uncharacterized protein (TIGR02246 family)